MDFPRPAVIRKKILETLDALERRIGTLEAEKAVAAPAVIEADDALASAEPQEA